MATLRNFPYSHEMTKDISIYPDQDKIDQSDILEIGPGRGDLFFHLCQKFENRNIICVEYGKKRVFKIQKNIEKRNIKNGTIIGGDARIVVPQFFKGDQFSQIYVLFPDPWPKDRHAYKRLLNLKFLWLLSHLLKPGGEFIHGTDVQSYSEWVRENLSQIPILENQISGNDYVDKLPDIPQTFFEEKWRKKGKDIYFIKYRKKKSSFFI